MGDYCFNQSTYKLESPPTPAALNSVDALLAVHEGCTESELAGTVAYAATLRTLSVPEPL
jgi:hypothetical protein